MAPSVTKFPLSGGANSAASWNTMLKEVENNFVYSGLTPSAGAGFTLNIAAGVAHVAGVRHDIGSGTATMNASQTNYVFYDADTLDYHVDTDNTAPTNSVKIATVTTDGSAITVVTDTRITFNTLTHDGSRHSMTQNVVTGSRAIGTVYQNTTGKPMFVVVTAHSSSTTNFTAYSDGSNPPTTVVATTMASTAGWGEHVGFWVMPNNYYKVAFTSGTLDTWTEWY